MSQSSSKEENKKIDPSIEEDKREIAGIIEDGMNSQFLDYGTDFLDEKGQ